MISSISSSEAAAGADWGRWLAVFAAVLAGAAGGLYVLLVLIDPYDTGRFPSLGISGIVDENPRTAIASRGHDPRFDAAVFGTSTGQMLEPRRLSAATGFNFVQLTVPGSGPREQLTLLRWYIGSHQRIGALVIASDEVWCTLDPALPIEHPFPFWLYGGNREYLANVLRSHSFDLAWRRIELALHMRTPTDPTGYSDYEAGKVWAFDPPPLPPETAVPSGAIPDMSFPGIEGLQETIASLSATLPVVLVMPPVFYTVLPQDGSEEAVRMARCKAALARLVADRPGSGFIDFRRDGPIARDPKNFMDARHYRADIAQQIEHSIAAVLRSERPPAGPL
jgi:hypothetical protein